MSILGSKSLALSAPDPKGSSSCVSSIWDYYEIPFILIGNTNALILDVHLMDIFWIRTISTVLLVSTFTRNQFKINYHQNKKIQVTTNPFTFLLKPDVQNCTLLFPGVVIHNWFRTKKPYM